MKPFKKLNMAVLTCLLFFTYSSGVVFAEEQENVSAPIVDVSTEDDTYVEPAAEEASEIDAEATNSVENSIVQVTKEKTAALENAFPTDAKYFKVMVEELVVYDNSKGNLTPVGKLQADQSYERKSDYGNWHQIRYGSGVGFVYKQSTVPAIKSEIPNPNSIANTGKTFTTLTNTDVLDNSSKALVKFAEISENVTYPIVGQSGNWYKVNIAGRLGFVYAPGVKTNFSPTDQFFKAKVDRLEVFDNSSRKLVKVAELKKDQVYKRVKVTGNWHQIRLGGRLLYVWENSTEPTNASSIKNLSNQKTGSNYFITLGKTPVFDNSSGSLVEFGSLDANQRIYFIKKSGNWYVVDFGGRIGYIHENYTKLPFKSSDRYFEVLVDNLEVFDNSLGYLRKVAVLPKGQTFQRVRDDGNWHRIKYGREYGYVYKASTKPASSNKVNNWGTPANSDVDFVADGNVTVYDNSSGKLVPFMTIIDKGRYPIIGDYGGWWKISVANRVGFVHKRNVLVGPIYEYHRYDLGFNEVLNIQNGANPKTDLYKNNPVYIHKDFVQLDPTGKVGSVTGDVVNVREGTNENAWIYGTVRLGQKLNILKQIGDWYEIEFDPWRNAKKADVGRYLNPVTIKKGTPDHFQFLVLSQNAGITPNDINQKILFNKGILKGKGQTFVQASYKYNLNEIYLISHALLETGNGGSLLANGILVNTVEGKPVTPRVVYNMFGIGAVDRCPDTCGAETAYKNGWFTPEAAIMGGAEFISTMYVNHPTFGQDTLYKMRWNPAKPGTHQYATDIGWAAKQVTRIKQLYDLLDHYTLYYDVPSYK